MKQKIRLTESQLRNIINKSVVTILRESGMYGTNASRKDFKFVLDRDVASFHNSPKGYTILYKGEEFGEAWYDRREMAYYAMSEYYLFGSDTMQFYGESKENLIDNICSELNNL